MNRDSLKKLEEAMLEFSMRVLKGECNMQETAILPTVLGILISKKPSDNADGS